VLLPQTEGRVNAVVERRAIGEPIQYITGEAEFYGLPFRVTSDVLIPRPETEHLVEKALDLAASLPAPRIVDVGTGSGCIAIAIAHCLPLAQITAIDLSAPALAIARQNAKRNGVSSQIRFLHGDLLAPVAQEQFEIVVSNPPYVPLADRAALAVEIRDHEPALALFAGDDGLDIFRRLIPAAVAALIPGGFLLLEIGHGQSAAVAALLAASGFGRIEFIPDLQSIPRVACAQRP
jgi:release factor glutamine methyltransferase